MGDNGKQYVESQFAWDAIIDKYIKFFEEVCING